MNEEPSPVRSIVEVELAYRSTDSKLEEVFWKFPEFLKLRPCNLTFGKYCQDAA